MKIKCLLIKILAFALFTVLVFLLVSCNKGNFEEVEDEPEMPQFSYIILPLLSQTQDTYFKIFSQIDYSNKALEIDGTEYFSVENTEYENESFGILLKGLFTEKYAEEYIEMIYGGESPLYREQDGLLYVNPQKLLDYQPIQFSDEFYVTEYDGINCGFDITDIEGNVLTYSIKYIDGIWYLNDYINK